MITYRNLYTAVIVLIAIGASAGGQKLLGMGEHVLGCTVLVASLWLVRIRFYQLAMEKD